MSILPTTRNVNFWTVDDFVGVLWERQYTEGHAVPASNAIVLGMFAESDYLRIGDTEICGVGGSQQLAGSLKDGEGALCEFPRSANSTGTERTRCI